MTPLFPSRELSHKPQLSSPEQNPGEICGLSPKLVAAHAKERGVSPENLAEEELRIGQSLHSSIREQEYVLHAKTSIDAQRRTFAELQLRKEQRPLSVFLGPTARVVDHALEGDAVTHLIARLISEGSTELLFKAIDQGPGADEIVWARPENPIELVASIVRWAALRGGDKKRIRTSAELRNWVGETLEANAVDTRPRLGGMTAVCTALAHALGDSPTMMALGTLPAGIAERLAPKTKVIGDHEDDTEIEELQVEGHSAGHYCISSSTATPLLPAAIEAIRVNGTSIPREAISKLELLITGASTTPGFGTLDQRRIASIGQSNEVSVLTGVQAIDSVASCRRYFESVQTLHNAGSCTALCYSEPKWREGEISILKHIKNSAAVDFLGLNTGEAYDLLRRINDSMKAGNPLALGAQTAQELSNALAIGSRNKAPWENGHESPEWVLRSALLLQEILEIPLVRVRARALDILAVDSCCNLNNAERIRDHLLVARHLGTTKAALKSGIINHADQLTVLQNPPQGRHLAALYCANDELRKLKLLHESWSAADFARDGHTRLRDGRQVFGAVPIHFFIKDGGTTSAGDTIDYSFVSFEARGALRAAFELNRERQEARKLAA